MTAVTNGSNNNADHHDGHGHSPFLAHHFEDHKQQFEAGNFGMWLFLAQEVLFFSGLFCAYAVYRARHPEVFVYAHYFLDTKMGAINTCVLILSSLTVAWAVRCAQLNQRKGLIINLIITFICACMFLCIKYVEYEHKWKDGLLWGRHFNPAQHESTVAPEASGEHAAPSVAHQEGSPEAGAGHDGKMEVKEAAKEEGHHAATISGPRPNNVHIFFGIYFAMTGLHAIHVIGGMVVIAWILIRAIKGHFSSEYYGPVEFVGLYWHLVDLIWIYLFPLLYLIH